MAVGRFLLGWTLSVAVLFVITLLAHADWCRPQIERAMRDVFHRNISLGHLNWSLGMNGLAISTSRISANEFSGRPFVRAGRSEIGIAFLPLLTGKIIVQHLDFDAPEVWAIRVAPDKWNFDDLLVAGPDIRFIQLSKGKLHLIDRAGLKNVAEPMELADVSLKFVWPKKNRTRPFLFAFKIHKPNYVTTVNLNGLGVGALQDWKTNTYKLAFKAQRVNPADVRALGKYFQELEAVTMPVINAAANQTTSAATTSASYIKASSKGSAASSRRNAPVPNSGASVPLATVSSSIEAAQTQPTRKRPFIEDLQGLFDISIKADGIFERGLKATADASVDGLSFVNPSIGTIHAPKASSHANFTIKDDRIEWQDCLLKLANIEVKSHGRLDKWQQKLPKYDAIVAADLKDFSEVAKIITPATESTLAQISERLNGRAQVEVHITGSGDLAKVTGDIKAGGITLKNITGDVAPGNSHWFSLVGISDNSEIHGDMQISAGKRFDIKNGLVEMGPTSLNVSGYSDLSQNSKHFNVSARKYPLKELEKNLANSPRAHNEIIKSIALPYFGCLIFDGFADMSASIDAEPNKPPVLDARIDLKDGKIALKDQTLLAEHLSGSVLVEKERLQFENLGGKMGDGNFLINGTADLDGMVDLQVHATRFDLSQLSRALQLIKVSNLPVLTEKHLSGRLKELTLTLKGPVGSPEMYFNGIPDELYYQPPGLARALKAVSGTIIYEKDQLTLKKVGLVAHGSTLTTGIVIDNVSAEATVRKVRMRSPGIDIADIDYFLSSSLMPPALKKRYQDFLSTYKLSGMHGKVYGDILAENNGKKPTLDGVVSLVNVGARVGDQNFPIEHLSGILAASGEELLLQDLNGAVRNTQFVLDGYVNKYKEAKPEWRTELRATVHPQELIELVPAITDQFKRSKLRLRSSAPLALRASLNGDADESNIIFNLKADKQDHVTFSGPFGVLHQPDGDELSADGSLQLTGSEIKLQQASLHMGDSVLQTAGSIKQPTGSAHGGVISLAVKSPNSVPARKVISVFDPEMATKDISGFVDADLSIDGPIANPRLGGSLALDRISVPKLNLFDVTGKLTVNSNKSARDLLAGKLRMDSIKLGYMIVRDISADMEVEPTTGYKTPKIAFSNGSASVASGNLKMNGWYDASKHRLHIDMNGSGMKAADLSDWLLGHSGELTGICDADLMLETQGVDQAEATRNLKGHGKVSIRGGAVSRFGHLQTKLTQANFLHQGVFGFNLNNLLQSMVPVRTGMFKELSAQVKVDNGILSFKELRFTGDDMRLWGAGTANLPLNTIDVEIAGKIPRVSSSLLGGPVGHMSRGLTVQKVVNTLTLGKLENLPSLPVLGNIASDQPRAFTFHIMSPLDKPKLLAHSIEKSFRWLPNKPTASAHPLPGL